MDYLAKEGNAIVFENDGETLRIEPWGENSLRVRAAVMREIKDTDYVRLPKRRRRFRSTMRFTVRSPTGRSRRGWKCVSGENAARSAFIIKKANCFSGRKGMAERSTTIPGISGRGSAGIMS